MFCSKCGKKLPDISRYCYYCGYHINKTPLPLKETMGTEIELVSSSFENKVKTIEILLDSGKFESVEKKCTELLDEMPEDGRLYLYLLLAKEKCSSIEQLRNQRYFDNPYFSKAFYYATDDIRHKLVEYHYKYKAIKKLRESEKKELSELYKGKQFSFGNGDSNMTLWKVIERRDNLILAASADVVSHQRYVYDDGWVENVVYEHMLFNEGHVLVSWKNGHHIASNRDARREIVNYFNGRDLDYYPYPYEDPYMWNYMILIDLNLLDKEVEQDIYFDPYSVCNWMKLRYVKRGDLFTYGRFENKEIEWKVIYQNDYGLTAISKYPLKKIPYNSDYSRILWDDSTLNHWLNTEFWEKAFTKKEQKMILSQITIPDKKILNEQLKGELDKCLGTYWWLEGENYYSTEWAPCVTPDGTIEEAYVDCENICVRPVIKLVSDYRIINDFIREGW